MGLRSDQIVDKAPPSDFRVEFGATDITDLVRSLEIEMPLPNDIRLPQLWSGSITLVQSLNSAEGRDFGVETDSLESFELDPQINNAWKAFETPLRIFADGRYICVLRLLEDLKYDYVNGVGTAQIGHAIRAFNSQKPKQVTDFDTGSSFNAFGGDPTEIEGVLPARTYAEKILEQATDADGASPAFTLTTTGLSDTLDSTFTFGGAQAINGYTTDPLPQESDIAQIIHEILWVNYGRALVSQSGNTENLTFSGEYPCFQGLGSPTLVIPAEQLQVRVERTSLERPSTVAEVSNSVLTRVRVLRDEFPKTWASATGVPPGGGDPVTAEETEMDEPNIDGDTTTTAFTKRSPEWFVVTGSTNSNIITLNETHTETSDSQGRPLSYEITSSLTRSQLTRMERFPELREAALANRDPANADITSASVVPNAFRQTTTWTYDSEGHKESITVSIDYPAQYVLTAGLLPQGDGTQGSGDGSTESYRQITRFERTDNSNINPEWWQTNQELVVRGSVDKDNGTSTQLTGKPGSVARSSKVSGVPAPEYKRREKPLTFQSFAENAFATTFGAETSARRIDIKSRYATSAERLSKTAELMVCINQQTRPESLDVTMAMPNASDNLEPFNIYHIGTGRRVYREAISCVRAGPRITYTGPNNGLRSQLEFAFTAYRLGDLAVTPLPVKLPVQPSTYLLPLSIAPIADRVGATCITIGVAITPIDLAAFEGTPPYTFTAPGGLPPGLSIVGSQIVGTPTTVAVATTFTIQVDDSAAGVDSTTFDIEVCAVEIPTPHYALTKRSAIRQPTRIAAILIDDTCIVTNTTGDTITTTTGDTVLSDSCVITEDCNVVLGTDNIIIGTDNVVQACIIETANVLVGTDNVVVGTDNVVQDT